MAKKKKKIEEEIEMVTIPKSEYGSSLESKYFLDCLEDAKECEEMQERGEYKECMECSCNGCMADEPDHTWLLQECYDELTNWITEECVLIFSLKKALGIN